ncbi:MAG: 7-cyano-7-deazaguanine synthase QueC [bacterium]|nr:7-cyano-7-deazaguanine synthase QueC [bacterium]
MDSAVSLAMARAAGFRCAALSFDYGQRHAHELDAARRVAETLGAEGPTVVKIDLRAIGGSALTGEIEVPKDRGDIGEGIPVTYVPARNTIFLSYALALAEVKGAFDIFIGVNALDYSGYPDCRPEYIAAYEQMARIATKAGVESGEQLTIHTPLKEMRKADIVKKGAALGVDFALTHSCYDPLGADRPCGRCDACILRRKGFEEAGMRDPLTYPEGGVRPIPCPD